MIHSLNVCLHCLMIWEDFPKFWIKFLLKKLLRFSRRFNCNSRLQTCREAIARSNQIYKLDFSLFFLHWEGFFIFCKINFSFMSLNFCRNWRWWFLWGKRNLFLKLMSSAARHLLNICKANRIVSFSTVILLAGEQEPMNLLRKIGLPSYSGKIEKLFAVVMNVWVVCQVSIFLESIMKNNKNCDSYNGRIKQHWTCSKQKRYYGWWNMKIDDNKFGRILFDTENMILNL